MIHRAGAVAEIQLGLQRTGQILLRMFDGLGQRVAKRQIRGDGGAQRAAGAMCVWIVDADAVEPRHRAIRLREHVIGVLGAMSTFDQCRTSIAFHNAGAAASMSS